MTYQLFFLAKKESRKGNRPNVGVGEKQKTVTMHFV